LVSAVAMMGIGTGLMVMAVSQLSRREVPKLQEELYLNWAAFASGLLVVGVITFGLVLRRR
jgi:hypothetical protein